jgi:hypothetical protein
VLCSTRFAVQRFAALCSAALRFLSARILSQRTLLLQRTLSLAAQRPCSALLCSASFIVLFPPPTHPRYCSYYQIVGHFYFFVLPTYLSLPPPSTTATVLLSDPRHFHLSLLSDHFSTRTHHRDWNSFILKGKVQPEFVQSCPATVAFFQRFRHNYGEPSHATAAKGGQGSIRLMTDTPFSFAFFSTLHPQTTIAPHHGPSNIRLRCHLPLTVPTSTSPDSAPSSSSSSPSSSSSAAPAPTTEFWKTPCAMKVGGETVTWKGM